MIAEVIFRHVFCRKTAKNGVMIVLLMRQHNLSYFQLFNCRINKIRRRGRLPQGGRRIMAVEKAQIRLTECTNHAILVLVISRRTVNRLSSGN